MKCGLGKVMGRKSEAGGGAPGGEARKDRTLSGEGIAMQSSEERGENIMSGKFQPKISLRNAFLYKVRCDSE